MKSYLLTVAYANEKVLEQSYEQLRRTMVTDPLPVLAFDNCYPLNWIGFMADLCVRRNFQYYTHGENVGLYQAWEYLLAKIPADCEKVILYDGDNFPLSADWHLDLLNVLEQPDIVHATLMNNVIYNEFQQRPHQKHIITHKNGQKVQVFEAKQAMTNTVCAFKTSFLQETGGIIGGKKYYGGNEIAMWKHYNEAKKWVFVPVWEDKDLMMRQHDWQYQQYKMLYAHNNLDMSFDQYIKTNPEKITNIEKHIWGK